MRALIIGGGYSGLAAALRLHREAADAEVILVDPDVKHVKTTRLHETLRRPLSQRQVAFSTLSERLGFRFVNVDRPPEVTPAALTRYQKDRSVPLDGKPYPFDALLVTSGASPIAPDGVDEHCYGLGFFADSPGKVLLDNTLRDAAGDLGINVIGAGASGVQFMFELYEALRERERSATLRLIDADRRPLQQQPEGVGRYVLERLDDAGIEFVPQHDFIAHRDGELVLKSSEDQSERTLPSQLCLIMIGREVKPRRLEANVYGQVLGAEDTPLDHVFAAGDCVSYRGDGLNAMTAQAAIRKAKLAAVNIARLNRGEPLQAYDYREVGYFVGLGDGDAAGWLNDRDTIVTGLPAAAIKTMIEKQYDLLLNGHDSYFDVNALQEKFASFGIGSR